MDAVVTALVRQLQGDDGGALSASDARWYLASIRQTKDTIVLEEAGRPFDGLTVWRLVRTLRPGPVTLKLTRRIGAGLLHRGSTVANDSLPSLHFGRRGGSGLGTTSSA